MSLNDYQDKLDKDINNSLDFFRGLIYALPFSVLLWIVIITVIVCLNQR